MTFITSPPKMGSPFNNPSATATATPNFDKLLLQSFTNRLSLHPQPPSHHPLLTQSLEDLLLDAATSNFSSPSSSDEDGDGVFSDHRTQLSKEESKLEKELVKIIHSGNTEVLKPNSGQAVTVGEHHVCVGFHDDTGSEYRVWEWHGHIMLFDDDIGYSPEYIYGNYFERRFNNVGKKSEKNKVVVDDDEEEEEDDVAKAENLGGLRDLIPSGDNGATRVLHQSRNAASPRVLKGPSGN